MNKVIRGMAAVVAVVLTLSFGAMAAPSGMTSNGAAVVNASLLNFRSEPSKDGTVLCLLANGAPIVVLSSIGEWSEVMVDGVTGYVSTTYISLSKELDFSVGEGTVTGDSVRLRSQPDLSASIVARLYTGETVSVTGVSGEWYKVTAPGDNGGTVSGYINSGYVRVVPQDLSVTRGQSYDTYGTKMVEYAKSFLGTWYVYGGSSPSGFDCSGLTYYVFRQFGFMSINRTASTQWNNGEQISKDSLEPGDLVFFSSSSSYSIEHVGMYIGNGQFIHSSSGKGCVTINNLSDWYYSVHYYGAVRIAGTNSLYNG